ncbi:MAG: hypothetical protein KFF73_18710 [Cyclobacteriaceae bacterium]|nr:hypothetical protein [Cyclobacteriaceae bacterium]
MKLILTILIYMITHSVLGQHDSFKFLEKNHKLNRNYKIDLNQGNSALFVSARPGRKFFADNREKLNIYPVRMEGDPRFIDPDMIKIRYDYRKFDYGNLVPNHLKPAGGTTGPHD